MNTKLITRIICIILALLMVASLVLFVIPSSASADNAIDDQLESLQKQKEQAEADRTAAQSKLDKLKNEEAEIVEEKMALEERNLSAQKEIDLIQQEIDLYNQIIAAKSKQVDVAQKKEQDQLEKFQTRIRAMEENGEYNILALILNAQSFSQLLASMDDYGDVMDSDKTLFKQLQTARKELEDIKQSYEKYKDTCEEKMAQLEQEQNELKTQIRESEERLKELAVEIEKAEAEQKAADAALAAASANISTFLNSYYQQKQEAQNSGQQTYTDSSTGITYDTSTQYSDSGYIWPMPSSHKISSTMKSRWGRQHTGIDIDGFCQEGAPIVAARAGTVILASVNGGYGNCVMIDHGDAVTLYGHMSYIGVSTGQAVTQGQTVGGCGMTGSATGVHLHFEVRINGSCVNPLDYFSSSMYELEPGASDES